MFPELSARVLDRKFVFVRRSIVSAGTASCLKVNLKQKQKTVSVSLFLFTWPDS